MSWMFTKDKSKVKEKENIAFSRLCDSTYDDLKKYILRLTNGNNYFAEEVIQRTYLIAQENRDILLAHPNPSGWLFTTARNISHEYMRENQKVISNEVELPEEIIIAKDNGAYNDMLEKIITHLSEKEKQLFFDYYIDNISLKQIAADRNESYEALRKFNYRLRKKLQSILKE